MLEPLANFFAFHDPDPKSRLVVQRWMEQSGLFTSFAQPHADWIIGMDRFPGSPPEIREPAQAGLFFAEGEKAVTRGQPDVSLSFWKRVAEMADDYPERLQQLSGDFTFIRFRENGSVTAVHSAAGLAPLYYWEQGERRAVSTRMTDFVRFLPAVPGLDYFALAGFYTGWGCMPEQSTYFAGIKQVPYGHFIVWPRHRRENLGRYWNPPLAPDRIPTSAEVEEHAARFRRILLEKLDSGLSRDKVNMLSLSGGTDSSALAFLSTGMLGRRLCSWSFVPSNEKDFAQENAVIRKIVERCRIEPAVFCRTDANPWFKIIDQLPRVAFPVPHPALCELGKMKGVADFDVYLGGELADNACGGTMTRPDWMEATSFFELLKAVNRLPFSRRDFIHWFRYRWRRFRGEVPVPIPSEISMTIRPEIRNQFLEWRAEIVNRRLADKSLNSYYRSELVYGSSWLGMNWEACSFYRVRRCLPFFNRELIELSLVLHPHEKLGPGPKKIIRRVLANDVPRENLFRSDKGIWRNENPGKMNYPSDLPVELEPLLDPACYPRPKQEIPYFEACILRVLGVFIEGIKTSRKLVGSL